jgi:hypothetical protein
LRIWCETVDYERLGSESVLEQLREHALSPLVAIRPSNLQALPTLVDRFDRAGIRFGLWPMLEDAEGRWANAGNLERFLVFVELVHANARAHGKPFEVAFDLEPDIALLRPLVHGSRLSEARLPESDERGLERSRGQLTRAVESLARAGTRSLAAVVPVVLLDSEAHHPWQLMLGTPVDGVPFDHVSVMAYTSLIEGWSRGALRRADALAMFAEVARRTRTRFGTRGGLSLGAIGQGAFGNEPTYRSSSELSEDVAVAHDLGIEELSLLDLGGVLTRPDEDWLGALTKTTAAARLPELTTRTQAALGSLELATKMLTLPRRLRTLWRQR